MKNGAILSNSEYFSCRNIKKFAVKFLLYTCIITNRKALYRVLFLQRFRRRKTPRERIWTKYFKVFEKWALFFLSKYVSIS